jgi:hypothetical protein
LGKVLIVAKNEVAINTAQASVDSFKKKAILLQFPQNRNRLLR